MLNSHTFNIFFYCARTHYFLFTSGMAENMFPLKNTLAKQSCCPKYHALETESYTPKYMAYIQVTAGTIHHRMKKKLTSNMTYDVTDTSLNGLLTSL